MHMPMDRVEIPIGLVAQLSYYQERKKKFSSVELSFENNYFCIAARKTISQMLMNDVQVKKTVTWNVDLSERLNFLWFLHFQLCQFYANVLYGSNDSEFIICDTFFTFTNLIKANDQVVSCLSDILSGPRSKLSSLKKENSTKFENEFSLISLRWFWCIKTCTFRQQFNESKMLFSDGTHDQIVKNILYHSEISSWYSWSITSMLFRRRFTRSKSNKQYSYE